jgi:aryl-alcohol dehydrogenase-like predicted oxidoreductase
LTGKYLPEAGTGEPRRYSGAGERVNTIAREVLSVADEFGATASQVAIAWVLAQPWLTVPIVGARSDPQLRDNLGALELELSDEHLERLGSVTAFDLGFPRSFLESDHVRGLIFGETFDLIDDHRAPWQRRREPAPV